MSMNLFRTGDTDHGLFSPATMARPRWLRQAELAELEHMLRSAIMSTMAEASRPVTVASTHRADGYAAVVLTGHLDGPAIRAAGAHLRGVLDAGSRHLVLDLSLVDQLDSRLPALRRRLESRMTGLGGIVEPRTAARHRAIIDNGADHPAPPPTTRPSVRARAGSGFTLLPYQP